MTVKKYRDGLPDIPDRIKKLPVDPRGWPVPWFVAEIDGKYDFRVIEASKMIDAVRKNLCWVCGDKLGSTLAFPIGPMCVVNRTIGEPPSHRECAEWSIKACPFLNQSEIKRNEAGLDAMAETHDIRVSRHGLKRQPGAICLWITRFYRPFNAGSETLFKIGPPDAVFWYCEGRPATRAEVLHSIETGLPTLRNLAAADGVRAVRDLDQKIAAAMKLLPSATPTVRRVPFGSAARR